MANWKRIAKDVGITGAVLGGGYALTSLASGHSSKQQSAGQDSKKNTGNTGDGADDSSGSSSSSDGGSSSNSTTKKKIVEVPITTYEEALDFANREWNKLKRNNGRTLECQVQGSSSWRTGEWCKVFLPSFDIDGYMYIIRVSQTSDGGDWTCNLSLVDYPPGWGQEELETDNENDEENSDSNEDSESTENTTDTNNTNNTDTTS